MIEHGPRSPRWLGHPRKYQAEAQRLYALDNPRFPILPWSWVTTDCDVDLCLQTGCMDVHAPRRIEYPYDVCVYCGGIGYTKDHLLPEPVTGKTQRRLVAVVPACGNCNSRVGDFGSANVSERRRKAQLSIERSNKHLLLRPIKGPAELAGLGHNLRTVAIKNNGLVVEAKRRLGWPIDPFYDVRAFQQSGIEDPVALGLCDPVATPLRPEYAVEWKEAG